ncbi:MAG: hypothetical protein AAFV25_20275, partial [Bacteroidota bacterium]
MKWIIWLGLWICLFPITGHTQNWFDTLRTVNLTAQASQQPLQLTLQWKDDPGNNTYRLYKKRPQDASWGDPIHSSEDQDDQFVDANVELGQLYEYRLIKQTGDSLGYGYLYSGVDYQPNPRKGDILLIIDSAAVNFVQENLTIYRNILRSEGWIPHILPVAKEASVAQVKSLILQSQQEVDSLTAIVLMGNIAVPHSGDINPDGHRDHRGAWPADLYYGDLDGNWTDQSVSNTSSAYPRLHNMPGDGNFDQDFAPTEIELMVGRLDFSELPIFERDEYELLNHYLQKNIDFRTGKKRVNRRAVYKNVNPWKEGLAQNAIRNFVPIVSADSIGHGNYFDAFYDSFLWSYGASSGSMINSNGMGSIRTYSDNNFQAVFTSNFGSYFGDYDYENNYLRTILASGQVLSASWVGAPNWHFHPMGLGFELGYCSRLTQNNDGTYYAGLFARQITINLLGDPTLQAFIVRPPSNLHATQDGNQMVVTWSPSTDDILGYQLYKKTPELDYFEPINRSFITDTIWVDSCVRGGIDLEYLVRAIKREVTASGSFLNYSAGPTKEIKTGPSILPLADFDVSWNKGILKTTNQSTQADRYQWQLSDGRRFTTADIEIPYTDNGELIVQLMAANECFADSTEKSLIITSVDNPTQVIQIDLFPNPSKGKVNLQNTV